MSQHATEDRHPAGRPTILSAVTVAGPHDHSAARRAFTLVEILIVSAIIGILALLAIASFSSARIKSHVARLAKDYQTFGDAFELYALTTGQLPTDTIDELPVGMDAYLRAGQWLRPTVGGGQYVWDGPDVFPYAGVAIARQSPPQVMMELVDTRIDDADLSSGRFQLMPNGRYTYLVQSPP